MLENNKIITLENMRNMSIDEIVELYKGGYRVDEPFLKPFLTILQTQTCPTGAIIGSGFVGLGIGLFLGIRLCQLTMR